MKTLYPTLLITAGLLTLTPLASAQTVPTPRLKPAITQSVSLEGPVQIGLARIDDQRLIAAPFEELRHWAALSMRFDNATKLFPVSPTSLNYVSAPFSKGGAPSSNHLDEIRLAAALQGQSFVLVYGEANTELSGVLLGTYTGRVYGRITHVKGPTAIPDFIAQAEALIGKLNPDAESIMTS